MNAQDLPYMERAVNLAEKTQCLAGRVHPKIGCVIVTEDRRRVVSGYHGEVHRCDHAEYVALTKKGLSARQLVGATVYTTLEPCTLRSPERVPCANRLRAAGVERVVIGMLDPNQDVCGKGVLLLRERGIKVDLFPHDLMRMVESQNEPFTELQKGKEWIPCGMTVADSEYSSSRILDDDTRSITVVGTNLRGPLTDAEFVKGIAQAIRDKGCRVTFICSRHDNLRAISSNGADSLVKSVRVLERLRRRLGKHRRKMKFYFTPDAVSISAVFRDAADKKRGLLILTPRWASDTEARTRPYCVVERRLHMRFFDKLYAGIDRIVEAKSTLTLDEMIASLPTKSKSNPKKKIQSGRKRSE